MYINVRAGGISQADRDLDKFANAADNAEKKALKLGMTFNAYNKTLSGLQSVAKATGASQESIASANLRVSQTENSLVDSNGMPVLDVMIKQMISAVGDNISKGGSLDKLMRGKYGVKNMAW